MTYRERLHDRNLEAEALELPDRSRLIAARRGAGVGALGGLVTTLVLTAVALTRTNQARVSARPDRDGVRRGLVGSLLMVS